MMTNERVELVDLNFLGHAGVVGTGVMASGGGVWLVDPGPSTALPSLESGLARLGSSLGDVRGLLLTHIHLDHAGASGTIVRRHPHVRVFMHERGAPHLIDPSRLMESAGRLYGDSLERLWGEVAPIPADNVTVLRGGECLDLDGRSVQVAYTPGHASHHVAYFDDATGSVFAGDVGGVRLAPARYLVPPTPPPDIDLQAWHGSIKRLREWQPSHIYVTHFGGTDDAPEHLDRLERRLTQFAELVRTLLAEQGSDEERMSRFIELASGDLRRAMPVEEAERYQLAVPLEHCWLGLARYWRKQGR